MMKVAALWMALISPTAAISGGADGVNLWVDPQSFQSKVPSESFSDAVHGKENMVLSTYRQRLLTMGGTLGSMVALPPTTPAPQAFDPELLKGEIKATLRDDPFGVGPAPESQSMKATEKATEDNVLGMASLREDIQRAYSASHSATAPTPAVAENPFWRTNYNPRGHYRMNIKQQFAGAGDVFTRYQQKLRGASALETAVPEVAKKPESTNVDTLLGIASAPQDNALMEQEARVLAKSFEAAAPHDPWKSDPLPVGGNLPYNVPDAALGLSGGELTTAEKQQWDQMTHPAPAHDASQDYPFVPVIAAHVDPPPSIPETPLGQMSKPGWQPRSRIPNLWDPPSQVSERIAMAHGQSAISGSESPRGRNDLWTPRNDGLVASLHNEGIEIPTSKQQWGDVFKRYQNRIHDRLDADTAALETGLEKPQPRPEQFQVEEPRGTLDDKQKFKFAQSLFNPLPSGSLNDLKTADTNSFGDLPNLGQNPFAALPPSATPQYRQPKHLPKTWDVNNGPLYDTHWAPRISLSQLTGQPSKVEKQEQTDALSLQAKGQVGLTQLKKNPFEVPSGDKKLDSQDKQLENVLSDLPDDPIETPKQRKAMTAQELWEAPVPAPHQAPALPQWPHPAQRAESTPPLFKSLLSKQSSTWVPPAMPDILKQDDVVGHSEHQRSAVTAGQLWGSEPIASMVSTPASAQMQPGSFPPLHLPTVEQLPAEHVDRSAEQLQERLQMQQQQLQQQVVIPEIPQPQRVSPPATSPSQSSDGIDDPAMTTDGMEPAAPQVRLSTPQTHFAVQPHAPVQALAPSRPDAMPMEFPPLRAPAQAFAPPVTETQSTEFHALKPRELLSPERTPQVSPLSHIAANTPSVDDTAIVTPTQAAAVLWGAFNAKPSGMVHQTTLSTLPKQQPVQLKSEAPAEKMSVSVQPAKGTVPTVTQPVAGRQVHEDEDPAVATVGFVAGGASNDGLDCSQPDPPPPCPWVAPELER